MSLLNSCLSFSQAIYLNDLGLYFLSTVVVVKLTNA